MWQNKEKKIESQKNIKKLFTKEKKIITDFNPKLKLDLTNIDKDNKVNYNENNYSFQIYQGLLNKIGKYKFSKLEDINQLNF